MKTQIFPDGGQINRSSITAMRLWSEILGKHQVEILVAVAAVGPSYHDVRAYLQQQFCFSSREPVIGAVIDMLEQDTLAA